MPGKSSDKISARPFAQRIAERDRLALPLPPETPVVTSVSPDRYGKALFVPVVCPNGLLLSVHGRRLQQCPVSIPSLAGEVASVNIAYTRLSECFELSRSGFGGNVFLNAYVNLPALQQVSTEKSPLQLHQLDDIRMRILAAIRRCEQGSLAPLQHAFRDVERNDRVGSALLVAERLHHEQRRKGTDIPYISHLLSVAAVVMEYGGTETEVVAALLHDAAEDQGGEPVLDEIEIAFGKKVANIVRACSDTTENPKPAWRERKERHLAHLPSASVSAVRVIAADKLHNLRSMLRDHYILGETLWERFNADAVSILWYHRQVAEIVRWKGLEDMAADLERVLDELAERIRHEEKDRKRRNRARDS